MTAWRVVWAEEAVRDLEVLLEYLAERDPDAAVAVWGRLKERAELLAVSPEQGRVVQELQRVGVMGYREVIVRPYRLVYRVDAQVWVVALVDGRREWEDVLFERLIRS